MVKINNGWQDFFDFETSKDYYIKLREILLNEYKNFKVFPEAKNIFNAFKFTDFKDIKVVILGQDPYHGEGQAMGLSFSVNEGINIPPSLKNIYKEIQDDIGIEKNNSNGDLTNWTKQGIFLLNTSLTVRKGEANSHSNIGWETFTNNAIVKLNESYNPKVFILWGNNARDKKKLITNKIHLILESTHPSPFSANNGFFGCKHFSKTNEFLEKNNLEKIKW